LFSSGLLLLQKIFLLKEDFSKRKGNIQKEGKSKLRKWEKSGNLLN